MRGRVTALLCAALFVSNALAQVEPNAIEEHSTTASEVVEDEVVVTGEQPGPGLWKVSKGDHVLWILGTHGPLPKKMIWRSSHVESLIGQSQELLNPVHQNIDSNIGFFKIITLIPTLMGVDKNPNDAELKDVLPPEIYARWLVLKEKYAGRGNSRLEKERPTFAVANLHNEAIKHAGLDLSPSVYEVVTKAAKKNKLKITTPQVTVRIEIDNPKAVLKKFRKTEFNDVECFSKTLDRFEADIDDITSRANAWAIGDMAALRRLNNPNTEDCNAVMMKAIMTGSLAEELGAKETFDKLKKEGERVAKEMEMKWLDAAETALANNKSTFAMLRLNDALNPEGYLAKLRERGYEVEEPL
jgi:TraB/PrgY/gumN family